MLIAFFYNIAVFIFAKFIMNSPMLLASVCGIVECVMTWIYTTDQIFN